SGGGGRVVDRLLHVPEVGAVHDVLLAAVAEGVHRVELAPGDPAAARGAAGHAARQPVVGGAAGVHPRGPGAPPQVLAVVGGGGRVAVGVEGQVVPQVERDRVGPGDLGQALSALLGHDREAHVVVEVTAVGPRRGGQQRLRHPGAVGPVPVVVGRHEGEV